MFAEKGLSIFPGKSTNVSLFGKNENALVGLKILVSGLFLSWTSSLEPPIKPRAGAVVFGKFFPSEASKEVVFDKEGGWKAALRFRTPGVEERGGLSFEGDGAGPPNNEPSSKPPKPNSPSSFSGWFIAGFIDCYGLYSFG